MFTITGTNTGGTVSTNINITVLDSLPIIEYVPSDVELLNNFSLMDQSGLDRWPCAAVVDFACLARRSHL